MKPGFHERISRFLYLEMEAKRKKQKKLRSAAAWFCLLAAVFLTACGQGRAGEKEGLEYEIVTEAELPAELASIISEKKEGEFKLTYVCDGSLYLVAGMGQQKTGGYSIGVKDLYLQSGSICLELETMGPEPGEPVSNAPSCPYLVLRLPYREEPVVFL